MPWLLFTWGLSPFGYVFALVAPANATVLTSSITFVFCAFASGFFGVRASELPEGAVWLLRLSPGAPCRPPLA